MNKIYLFLVFSILTTIGMAQEKIKQTAGRDQLGTFAPKFAELNDDVLFGEVWSRTDRLGLRDRSLVTITSLISQGITDSSLTFHLQSARNNGITRTEIAEIITHIGFYAGWPKAWAAFRLAKEVWAEDTNGEDAKAAFQREMIFPIGEPNAAYARYFTGNSYLAPISREQVYISNVTFEPGCRNNWHIHRAKKGGGQMLIGVAGRGWYQEEGKPANQEAKNNIADYDFIFIGYPIWWNLAPRIIDTFIETHHLAGKTLIPFATSGGSGITNSVGALKKAYPDLNWKEGKLLNRMDENGIREWIGKASKD